MICSVETGRKLDGNKKDLQAIKKNAEIVKNE